MNIEITNRIDGKLNLNVLFSARFLSLSLAFYTYLIYCVYLLCFGLILFFISMLFLCVCECVSRLFNRALYYNHWV